MDSTHAMKKLRRILTLYLIFVIITHTITTTPLSPPSLDIPSRQDPICVLFPITNAIGICTEKIHSARRHLVAAAVARSVSILSMYPIGTFFIIVRVN